MDLSGIFSLKGLPKYSPFLTLVEAAIPCWKPAMKRKMQEMDLFINVDALKEPGQKLQDKLSRHAKSIVERTSCEVTPQKCVGWYNHTMTYIPDTLSENKNRLMNNGCCIKTNDSVYYILFLFF